MLIQHNFRITQSDKFKGNLTFDVKPMLAIIQYQEKKYKNHAEHNVHPVPVEILRPVEIVEMQTMPGKVVNYNINDYPLLCSKYFSPQITEILSAGKREFTSMRDEVPIPSKINCKENTIYNEEGQIIKCDILLPSTRLRCEEILKADREKKRKSRDKTWYKTTRKKSPIIRGLSDRIVKNESKEILNDQKSNAIRDVGSEKIKYNQCVEINDGKQSIKSEVLQTLKESKHDEIIKSENCNDIKTSDEMPISLNITREPPLGLGKQEGAAKLNTEITVTRKIENEEINIKKNNEENEGQSTTKSDIVPSKNNTAGICKSDEQKEIAICTTEVTPLATKRTDESAHLIKNIVAKSNVNVCPESHKCQEQRVKKETIANATNGLTLRASERKEMEKSDVKPGPSRVTNQGDRGKRHTVSDTVRKIEQSIQPLNSESSSTKHPGTKVQKEIAQKTVTNERKTDSRSVSLKICEQRTTDKTDIDCKNKIIEKVDVRPGPSRIKIQSKTKELLHINDTTIKKCNDSQETSNLPTNHAKRKIQKEIVCKVGERREAEKSDVQPGPSRIVNQEVVKKQFPNDSRIETKLYSETTVPKSSEKPCSGKTDAADGKVGGSRTKLAQVEKKCDDRGKSTGSDLASKSTKVYEIKPSISSPKSDRETKIGSIERPDTGAHSVNYEGTDVEPSKEDTFVIEKPSYSRKLCNTEEESSARIERERNVTADTKRVEVSKDKLDLSESGLDKLPPSRPHSDKMPRDLCICEPLATILSKCRRRNARKRAQRELNRLLFRSNLENLVRRNKSFRCQGCGQPYQSQGYPNERKIAEIERTVEVKPVLESHIERRNESTREQGVLAKLPKKVNRVKKIRHSLEDHFERTNRKAIRVLEAIERGEVGLAKRIHRERIQVGPSCTCIKNHCPCGDDD